MVRGERFSWCVREIPGTEARQRDTKEAHLE